jgi:UrcA family protein
MNRFTTTMMISALGLGSQLADAASPQDPPAVIVRFADLDLSHSQGAAVLYRRLKSAAETVCGVEGSVLSRDLGSHKRSQECIRSALDAAVAKVNQPALTAYYRAQFEGRNATSQIAKN